MPAVLKVVQIHFLVVALLVVIRKEATLHTIIRVILLLVLAVPVLTSTDIEGQTVDQACA
jgi:hypothetical protein